MMRITIEVRYPERDPQAIKEALALDCEKYGAGVRVVRVDEVRETEQTALWGRGKERMG